jgi:hypothetical protein
MLPNPAWYNAKMASFISSVLRKIIFVYLMSKLEIVHTNVISTCCHEDEDDASKTNERK